MKMGKFEMLFVNSATHSESVAEAAVRRLRSLPIGADQTYLDVGCGNGAATLRVADAYGLSVTGVDVDPQQIEAARRSADGKINVRLMLADATCLPFGEAEFDVVATNKTTHHVPEWKKAIAEMIRVLKPGGYLVYSDLVIPGRIASVLKVLGVSRYGLPTRRGIERLLEQENMRVVCHDLQVMSFEVTARK